MLTIIDYGVGNVGAIANMLRYLEVPAEVTADPARIREARALILPGVGAFDHGASRLRESGLGEALEENVRGRGRSILGICLGMQLLCRSSEEGEAKGLGWIDAEVRRFRFDGANARLPVPHMGWNDTRPKDTELFRGLTSPRFYYVHSYHVVCERAEDVAAVSDYGGEFVAALRRGNIFGTQFHPEKSHKFGMTVLKNFAEIALRG